MSLEDLSQLVLERDEEIETLHVTLDQREKEKQAHQEELTELRRSAQYQVVVVYVLQPKWQSFVCSSFSERIKLPISQGWNSCINQDMCVPS